MCSRCCAARLVGLVLRSPALPHHRGRFLGHCIAASSGSGLGAAVTIVPTASLGPAQTRRNEHTRPRRTGFDNGRISSRSPRSALDRVRHLSADDDHVAIGGGAGGASRVTLAHRYANPLIRGPPTTRGVLSRPVTSPWRQLEPSPWVSRWRLAETTHRPRAASRACSVRVSIDDAVSVLRVAGAWVWPAGSCPCRRGQPRRSCSPIRGIPKFRIRRRSEVSSTAGRGADLCGYLRTFK